jgi:chromosome segregation ATPase
MDEQITNALDRLHNDLNELAPAIEHVKMAESVTKAVSEIPKKHIELLSEIEKVQQEYKTAFKEILDTETKDLLSDHKELLEELNNEQQQISSLVTQIKNYSDKIDQYLSKIDGIDFPTRLNSIDNDISSISVASNNLQGSVNTLQQNLTAFQQNTVLQQADLKQSLDKYHLANTKKQEEIEKFSKLNRTFLIIILALTIASLVLSIAIN